MLVLSEGKTLKKKRLISFDKKIFWEGCRWPNAFNKWVRQNSGGDLFVKGVANRQNTLYIMSWIKCIPPALTSSLPLPS